MAGTPQVKSASSEASDNTAGLQVNHVSRQEAVDRGREARRRTPRSSQAVWEPPPGRTGPVDILAEQAKSREPDLVPIRHGRMLVSPFTFFRGAAAIMAADLAHTPSAGIRVQLCGDAHLLNFGGFASPERSLVFDVNDFDETLPGPFEWDVKRLAASFEVAGRTAGLTKAQRADAIGILVRQYRDFMRSLAGQPELDVWYTHLDEAALLERLGPQAKSLPNLSRNIQKARSKDSMKAFAKLTTMVDGEPRIVADPPLITPIRDLVDPAERPDHLEELRPLVRGYRRTLQGDRRHLLEQYRLVDAARKVVGVGSVGTRCWIVLLMGRDNNDPLFLQFKEAQDSVLAPFSGKSKQSNQGQRVVEGQRLMQATSDIFLGWIRAVGLDGNERDFYARQLWDWKISVDPDAMTPTTLGLYAQMCGWTLARAHARSGDRIAMAEYLGSKAVFDHAITEFAFAYSDQNERDYTEFAEAVKDGTLAAEPGL